MVAPLKPPTSLLCKLGSIIVHCKEMISSDGHSFDKAAFDQLLQDREVVEWMSSMDELALLPVMRKPESGSRPSRGNPYPKPGPARKTKKETA